MVDDNLVSLAAYGNLHGKSKQAAAKWKASGHLVIVGGKVDVAASDALMQGASLGRFSAPRESRPDKPARIDVVAAKILPGECRSACNFDPLSRGIGVQF